MPMECLEKLEFKVNNLITLYKQQQETVQLMLAEKNLLMAENVALKEKIALFEEKILLENQNLEEINQDNALTKLLVDDIMHSIDTFILEKQ